MAGFETYDTPEKLKSLLQKLLSQKRLPIFKGKLARFVIEKTHGFQENSLSNSRDSDKYQWCKNVVNDFEKTLIEEEGGHIADLNFEYGTAKRLKKLLDELRNDINNLPITFSEKSGGRISVQSFEKKFKFPSHSLQNRKKSWLWACHMLDAFSKELFEQGIIDIVWKRKTGFGSYDTPEKLKSFLQELLSNKKLPIYKGRIARSVIEERYGFQENSLSNSRGSDKYQWCKNVVDDFEKTLINEEGGHIADLNFEYGTAKRFKKLLDKLRDDIDSLPIASSGTNAGRISVKSFERKFQFPMGSLQGRQKSWLWAHHMLKEFDEKLYKQGVLKTGIRTYNTPEKLISLLQELLTLKRLPIHAGKLVRGLIEKKYGFQQSSLSNPRGIDKYQWCKDVVDDFEKALIEEEGGHIADLAFKYGTAKRFKTLLDKLRDDIDSLPIASSGKNAGRISVKAFERKFKFPKKSLQHRQKSWLWAHHMLKEFEDELYDQGVLRTEFETYNTPEKLNSLLQELLSYKKLQVYAGKLSRSIIEKTCGFPVKSLSNQYSNDKYQWCKNVVDDFEKDLIEAEGGYIADLNFEYGTAKRFKHLLEKLKYDIDSLPISNVGKSVGRISFRGFERKFKFPKDSLSGKSSWHWAHYMLNKFDGELYEQGVLDTALAKRGGFEKYNSPENLKSLLQELLSLKKLPIFAGKLARGLIEETYGFQHGTLSNSSVSKKYQWRKNVVDDFEKNLIEEEGGHIADLNFEYGTAKRFKKLLDKLEDDIDNLPIANGGKNAGLISREYLERKFKFPALSLHGRSKSWRWANIMLIEFEKKHYERGVLGAIWERKVPNIRKYLEKLEKNQKLPINEHGKLNRKLVMSEFGFQTNQSTTTVEKRSPKLKELFKEYDKLISQQNYSQYTGDKYKDALLEIFKNKELVLDSSLRVISMKWLVQELGISKGMIKSSPKLMKLISERTQSIHQTQLRGVTKKSFNVYGTATVNLGATPYSEKHDRVFSFSSLIKLYNLEFAEKIGTAFIAISNKSSTSPNSKYFRILHFFRWLANPENIDINVAHSLRDNQAVNIADFGRACMAYRATLLLENPRCQPNTFIITQFGEARVIPKYTFLTQNRANRANKDKSHKQSILEASIKKNEIEQLEEILIDSARYRGIKISKGKDTKGFLQTLMFEKANNPDLPDDLSKAMHEISKSRLLEIRIQASKTFKQWQELHKEGLQLLDLATVDCDEFRSMLEEKVSISSQQRTRYLQGIFPLENKKLTLANLLKVIKTLYNSCPPSTSTTKMRIWQRKYQLFGGIERVASFIGPTQEAISSALILYLCESGANIAVALTLPNDCVRKSDVAQHKKVIGKKDRANGKPIYDDLMVKSDNAECVSAVNALEYLCSAQPKTDNDTLLCYLSGTFQPLTDFCFRSTFKAICNQSDYLKQLRLVPSMLRPTVLLNIQLKDPANLGVAQLIAQHESNSTTEGYTNKLPHRVQMEKDMLEFQQIVEAVMTYNVNDAYEKLNMTQQEWNEQKKKLEKTGWGIFCKDREIVTDSGEKFKCNEVENCVRCKHDRMLVIADPESISDMIIWKTALENNEAEFTAKNMYRWIDVWAPWLAFFTVVLEEKMTRGKFSFIKKQAIEIAAQKMSDSDFSMPEPW